MERMLLERGISIYILVIIAWSCAHLFDRMAVVVKQELRFSSEQNDESKPVGGVNNA